MNAIKPITVTADTVTLAKADYQALLDALEEAHDLARIRQIDADLAAGRTETMPLDMALPLCEGANPVRVWRQHRGMIARELAALAGIAPAYLSEIETGKKAGSINVLTRIASVLKVDLDDLVQKRADTARQSYHPSELPGGLWDDIDRAVPSAAAQALDPLMDE